MKRASVLIFFLCIFMHLEAQSKKTYQITRTQKAPTIDGVLNESVWSDLQIATDFIQFRPNIGNTLPNNNAQKLRQLMMTMPFILVLRCMMTLIK